MDVLCIINFKSIQIDFLIDLNVMLTTKSEICFLLTFLCLNTNDFSYICTNIPASSAYGVCIAAQSICKSLLDIGSVFISRQSINRHVDVTGV
jgi:hypothetical protein